VTPSKEHLLVPLIQALERRIESDDSMENGLCDCVWCIEDRELLKRAKRQLAADEGVFV
jgi:hypothetical protein